MAGTLADLHAQAARMAENQQKALAASKATAAKIEAERAAQPQEEPSPVTSR